jgi:hypothetical protein
MRRGDSQAGSHHSVCCARARFSPPFEGGVARMRRGGSQVGSHHPDHSVVTPPRKGGDEKVAFMCHLAGWREATGWL